MKLVPRVLAGAAAAGAACAAAGTVVVALSFALYAFAKPYVGAAGASAIVAGVVALLALIGFLIASATAGGSKRKPDRKPEPQSLMDRVLETAKERPIVAVAGAIAAGLLAFRNPALVATVLGLINQPPRPRRD